MFKYLIFVSTLLLVASCNGTGKNTSNNTFKVTNVAQLKSVMENVVAGDQIIMANGKWTDVQIEFYGKGAKGNPIVLKAETPGKVTIEGASNLSLGGQYLEVSGLHFKNGHTPTKNVVQFKIGDNIASNCTVTHCVIEDFTQPNRDATDHWVEFWGRNNTLSHCYIAGKSNFGPTVMVMLKGNQHIKNHHQIVHNHFGPRPRKGGPHGETMQIGDSGTSMAPSHTVVAGNLFERCNGEVEIISSKSNYNQFRNNVFFESEGSLVLRHGNYATINGNIFIGNDNSEFIGGIRVINTGHWITNNYFYKLKGSVFRAPLAVMNGIPKSPQNRYNQVTDVVVAYNSYINCGTPFHFSVGSNVSQSEVLPKSEIRSARPIRTVVANNLVYNESEMVLPVKAYDTIDGVAFYNNLLSSKNKSNYKLKGLSQADLKMKKISAYLFAPHKNEPTTYNGFDFETITTDLFGTPRNNGANTAGAIVVPVKEGSKLFDPSDYGPHWFLPPTTTKTPKTVVVGSKEEFIEALASAKARAVISLKAGTYQFSGPIVVNKDITLISEDKANKAQLVFSSKTTAFEMHPKGKLRLQSVTLKGDNNQHAFKTLDKNMAQAYGLFLENAELHKFKSVLEVSKGSFADTVSVVNSVIKDTARGFQLNKETNDKGDYNAAFVILKNTTFTNIAETVLDYYRGGYDESTIGGHLTFTNNTVAHSGSRSPDGILIKNRGIVNVQLSKNTFTNNPVKLVAVLWGEKGQKPVGNTLVNSGGIRVVQNLELKLMY